MKQMGVTIGIAVIVGVIAIGCGRGTRNNAARPIASIQDVAVRFRTEPGPPQVGENTFEAMVMAGGQPVTNAGASVELVMPAMPSMNMAEMRSTVALKHGGGGRYRGAGAIAMAGAWRATVTVTRSNQTIGSSTFPVTARSARRHRLLRHQRRGVPEISVASTTARPRRR